MANIEQLQGSDKLREMYPKVNRNFEALNNENAAQSTRMTQIEQDSINRDTAHAQSTAAHDAENITFTGAGIAATKAGAAIREVNNRVSNIVASQVSGKDNEVIDMRLGADGVARATAGALVREIHGQQLAANRQSVSLGHGLNVVNTNRTSPLYPRVKGRTLVNLIKDGNCETVAPFPIAQGSRVLDPSAKTIGNNSILATITAGANLSLWYDFNNTLDTSKYYIGLADVKNNDATDVRFRFHNGSENVGSVKYTGTSFITKCFKLSPANFKTAQRIYFDVYGAIGQSGNIDAIRLYEITAEEFSRVDVDPEYTGDKLAEKFPYVDSVKHVVNPVISTSGKNLIPPFTDPAWTLHANAKVKNDYDLELNATANNQWSRVKIPVKPNTTYTFSYSNNLNGGQVKAQFFKDTTYLSNLYSGTTVSGSVTGTTPSDCNYINVEYTNNNVTTGIFTFTNSQLELGSVATPFEPQNKDYLYAETILAGNNTVKDELYQRDGQFYKLKKWQTDVVLDGSLNWLVGATYTGYKRVKLILNNVYPSINNLKVEKFNGLILETLNNFDIYRGDQAFFDTGGNNQFNLTISDEDATGYDLTTSAGIKAYFNAKPYKLTYQLATPTEEPVKVEGSLSVDGPTQVEVSEGVVVREKVTPVLSSDYYYINSGSGTKLKNRADAVLSVYKNGVDEKRAEKIKRGSNSEIYGLGYARIKAMDYDSTAEYTVTYLALDKYAMTANTTEVVAEYETTAKSVQDALVQQVADAETQVSINVKAIASIYARLKAGGL